MSIFCNFHYSQSWSDHSYHYHHHATLMNFLGNTDGSLVSKENMNLLLEKLNARTQQSAATMSLQNATLSSTNLVCFEDLIKFEMSQEMKRQRDSDDSVTYKKNTKNLGTEHSLTTFLENYLIFNYWIFFKGFIIFFKCFSVCFLSYPSMPCYSISLPPVIALLQPLPFLQHYEVLNIVTSIYFFEFVKRVIIDVDTYLFGMIIDILGWLPSLFPSQLCLSFPNLDHIARYPFQQYNYLFNWNLISLPGMRYLSRVRHTDTSLLSSSLSLKTIPNTSRRRLKNSASPLLLSSSLPLPLSHYRLSHSNEDGYDLTCDSSRNTVYSGDTSFERSTSGSFLTNPTCPIVGYPTMMSIDEK